MIQAVDLHDFRKAFSDHNRSNQFSYEGQAALFEYLEQYEEDTGEAVQLDVVALSCEYTEYETLEDFQEAYGDEYESLDDISHKTIVIGSVGESFIIQDF